MFNLFRHFIEVFGNGFRRSLILVLFGDALNGALELMGVLLIFPLMSFVDKPESIATTPFLSSIYNFIGFTDPRYAVVVVSALIGLVYGLRALIQVLVLGMENKILSRWKHVICDRMLQCYMAAPYSLHMQKSSPEIFSTISHNVVIVINNFVLRSIMLVSNLMIGFSLITFMLIMYPAVSLFAALVTFSLIKAQKHLISSRINKYSKDFSKQNSENLLSLHQGIYAYREAKINLREPYFINKFSVANKRVMESDGKFLFYGLIPIAGAEFIIISITIIAFNMIMFSAPSQESVIVNLAAMVMTVFRMVPVINRSLTALSSMNSASDLVRNLTAEAQLIGYQQWNPDQAEWLNDDSIIPLEVHSRLELRGLSYRYPNRPEASLDNVSLTIPKGEFLGVIGASGSGKSTLIGILLGFLVADSGEYLVDGTPITLSNIRALRKSIGFIDQQAFISDGSIRDNVAFGYSPEQIDDERIISALKSAELWDFVQGLENGLDQSVGEGGKLLSGGQRQRLVLARALYKQPTLLILDEATSALDMETEARISESILSLKGSVTIISIAHRLSALRGCDRLIVMDQAKIVRSVNPDDLIDLPREN